MITPEDNTFLLCELHCYSSAFFPIRIPKKFLFCLLLVLKNSITLQVLLSSHQPTKPYRAGKLDAQDQKYINEYNLKPLTSNKFVSEQQNHSHRLAIGSEARSRSMNFLH